jgi:hypothetical protein
VLFVSLLLGFENNHNRDASQCCSQPFDSKPNELRVPAASSWHTNMAKRKADRAFELVSLGRASYASHSAIAKLLAEIDAHGLPETYDRSAQYRARKEVCRTVTPYGTLVTDVQVPLAIGGDQKMTFQNPLAFLQHNCLHSEHYAKTVSDTLDKHPPSAAEPWRIILYQDGIDPSDGLSTNHSRKSCVFYWSFAEFGLRALAHEECWGTIVVARYSEHQKLDGGVAQLFEKVLDQFFNDTHDIRRSGVSVTLPCGRHALIIAEASILLADMPAIKECISCKGHSGTMCCPLCVNASQHKSAAPVPLHLLCKDAVSISNINWHAFKKHTDETIRIVVRRINDHHDKYLANEMSLDDYKLRTSVLGWNHTAANIALNPRFRLNIASMIMYDWAHVMVHDGLADVELGMCMKVFYSNRSQTSFQELGEYVSTFTFPKAAPNPTRLFTASANLNNSKKGSFTCSGSEFLTLAPVIHRYFSRVVSPRGQFMTHVRSLLAVLTVVMMLMAVRTGTIGHTELFEAITSHLALFITCYGEGRCRPKHHYALHLADMLRRFGFLLSTFTHERKHRLVTRYTRDRKNLRNWDAGSIEEITCHQLWELRQPFFSVCRTAQPRGRMLLPLRELFPAAADKDFVLLNDISANGGSINAGDVVSCVIDGHVQLGELLVTVAVAGGPAYSLISVWQPDPESKDNDWRNFLVSREDVIQVPLKSLDTVFTHRMSSNRQSCMVFMPFEVRPK